MKLIILKQRQQSHRRLRSQLTSPSLGTPPPRCRLDKKEIPFRNTPRRAQRRDRPPAQRFRYLPSTLRLGLPTRHTQTLTILSFSVFFSLSVRIPSNSEFDASPRRRWGSGNLSSRMTRQIGDVLESNPVPYWAETATPGATPNFPVLRFTFLQRRPTGRNARVGESNPVPKPVIRPAV